MSGKWKNAGRTAGVASLAAFSTLMSCSRSNNLLMGRVESKVGTHTVVVTDCYRTSVPEVEKLPDATWRWTPCRDAEVRIRGEQLEVNGRVYGKIGPADSVLVDHGVVSVEKK
jgi:hypothetical protein